MLLAKKKTSSTDSYTGHLERLAVLRHQLEQHDALLDYDFSAMQRLFTKALIPVIIFLGCFVLLYSKPANAASRIKDIVYFEGIRDNQLVGYGLVVGLNGTGDNLQNSPFTEKVLAQFLSRQGVSVGGTNLKTKNVAAVTITANLPPFSRSGNRIDVSVGTLGDAKSLKGGTLLATPLLGADGSVYAVAQGPVSISRLLTARSDSNANDKSVPTSGIVAGGAIVEQEVQFSLNNMKKLSLALRNPDISTARRISESINDIIYDDMARPLDPGTVEVSVPAIYSENVVGLLADIEQIIIQPDQIARVIIDESSGTIVIGENVKVDTVAVAQGNLLVTVRASQARGDTRFSTESGTANDTAETGQVSRNRDPGNGLAIVRQGANLRDLVTGLNALGVGTRDLISILQTIKVAGALHANIETR